jgi:hypothetical protein
MKMAIEVGKKQRQRKKHYSQKTPAEKTLDNLRRSEKRRNRKWGKRVAKVDSRLMSQITHNTRRIDLDLLNKLDAEAEF